MKDVVIVGAGGLAREIAWMINDINAAGREWNFLGYIGPDSASVGTPCGKHAIIGDDSWLRGYAASLAVVIAIGTPGRIDAIRKWVGQNSGLSFPNLVHPSVIWNRERIHLGVGNLICAGNILTTDIRIGSFNVLNLASTYGHDALLGDCCVINPGVNLSGGVRVGNGCLIGTGAVVLENLTLGEGVTVGGGAVVTKDVAPRLTVVGIPAKPLVRTQEKA